MSSPYVTKLDPWSSHMVIYRWLQKYPPLTRILDVGTASGTFGRLCWENKFHLVGIEPNLIYANEAKPFYTQIINRSLEETSAESLKSYQVIILADVLEHLPDPQDALSRLVTLQDEDTVFLISVPNIANLWMRLSLLAGRFDYRDRGILDKTHLHFFTKASLLRMVSEVGLGMDELEVTPIPLNLVHPFFNQSKTGRFFHRLLAKFSRLLPTLLGYQFVVQVQKRSA